MNMIDSILNHSPSVRYVAVYKDGQLTRREQPGADWKSLSIPRKQFR